MKTPDEKIKALEAELKATKATLADTQKQLRLRDCKLDTIKHIEMVRKYMKYITDKLTQRALSHDKSKLESPEVELFAEVNYKLSGLTYGSPEYAESLKELEPALAHHRAKNKHHFEHFPNGVNDVTLVDLMETMCDWKASSLRQHDGNLLQSIELNGERFHIEPQLMQILKNTAVLFDEADTELHINDHI